LLRKLPQKPAVFAWEQRHQEGNLRATRSVEVPWRGKGVMHGIYCFTDGNCVKGLRGFWGYFSSYKYRPFRKLAIEFILSGKIWEIFVNIANRRLAKPVYKRQQFLLAFLKEFDEPLAAIDFQKLLFLYLSKNNLPYYDFVPYLYGSYSIQAGEDINTLQAMGWLADTNGKIRFAGDEKSAGTNFLFEGLGGSVSEQLPKVRGNRLVKLVYEQYPYFAINSRTANSIMSAEGVAKIKTVRDQLKNTKQMLFTIGYEGITIEQYLNILIKNNVRVLCDVRNNPLSRKFGFSKNSLQKYLGNIGIEYVHLPELGIKSEKRNNLSSDEDYRNLFVDYEASLPDQKDHLEQLFQLLVTKGRIALTCFEHDPSHCHRHVVRDYLKKTYDVETTDL
jgi:hypothetical protein